MIRDRSRPSPALRFPSEPARCGWLWLAFVCLLATAIAAARQPAAQSTPSRAAAASCSAKVEKLEKFADSSAPGRRQTTRFSQIEINSYLAFDLSPQFNPSLKSLVLNFEEDRLRSRATIDFDKLGMSTSRMLARLMASMFHGTHVLSARGKIVSGGGKANFQLEEARFDDTALPNVLVEEIISLVGKKQRPPFDPMQPSQMPYRIQRVELHSGTLTVYQ